VRGYNYRMTEIQAAIGLVQLGKLSGLLDAQRRNEQALRERLDGLDVSFRTVVDDGQIADTLIFALDDAAHAAAVATRLGDRGVGTKNLPDALGWHFAGTWDHLLPDAAGRWPRTRALLERSIALPVNAVMSEREIEHVAAVARDAVRRPSAA
jgi:8-amino-3,8-dideoxy-alpha-D-manno-octulosonate transaminase